MGKKKDPAVTALAYFRTADLALARQVLALAKAVIAEREPKPVKSKAPGKKGKARQPVDVPLPGLQSQVG